MGNLVLRFPPGVAVCTNSSDCGGIGVCSVLGDDDALRCLCPRFYDAQTRCAATYDSSVSDAFLVPFFVIVTLAHLVYMACVARPWWAEARRWFRCGGAPRLMFVTTSAILFLSAMTIATTALYMARRTPEATVVNVVGTSLFAFCYDIIVYSLLVLVPRTKNLGTLAFKWRVASRIVLVAGLAGLSVSLSTGLAREFAPLAFQPYVWTITVGVVIGVAVPTVIGLACFVSFVVWIAKRPYKTERGWRALWRYNWIAVAATLFMVLTMVLVIGSATFTAEQLPDAISLRRVVVAVTAMIEEAIFVVLVRLMPRKRRRDSGSKTPQTTTPETGTNAPHTPKDTTNNAITSTTKSISVSEEAISESSS